MKQNTRTHHRRLKRAEKVIVSNAGLNPHDWNFAGANERYIFLTHKRFSDRAAVPKAPNVKNAPQGVSITVCGA